MLRGSNCILNGKRASVFNRSGDLSLTIDNFTVNTIGNHITKFRIFLLVVQMFQKYLDALL